MLRIRFFKEMDYVKIYVLVSKEVRYVFIEEVVASCKDSVRLTWVQLPDVRLEVAPSLLAKPL